jgi:S-adenosylmethionine:tRNA ribosyltransferase-isomerase
MNTAEFDYSLTPQLIAQTPVEPRDHSRLMVLHRNSGRIEYRHFFELADILQPGEILVFNDSRVIPARLRGHKLSGGKVEFLLLRRLSEATWESLVKPARRVKVGDKVKISPSQGSGEKVIWGEILASHENGLRVVHFSDETLLEELGEVPLPPYIHTSLEDPERYQTIYAHEKGSVAAPTAGLHFTQSLFDKLTERGIEFAFITLHVGLDSFRPVQASDPHDHPMHQEYVEIDEETATKLAQAKAEGRHLTAVGTTVVRALEQAAFDGELKPFSGWTSLFILPGYQFKAVDSLITNFHLPRSTLLMLVSAFAGKELIDRAYQEAIRLGYRFYSFGDAMLIL